VTVVVPTGNIDPDAGEQTVEAPGQFSPGTGVVKVTTMLLRGGQVSAVTAVIFCGQLIVGACVSFTVTVNEQVAVLPPASVAVQVTVVVPMGKGDPEAGEHMAVAPGQLSETVPAATLGVGNVGDAPHWPAAFDTEKLFGQEMVGGSSSTTVTF
jgi:hypothetical protein